MHSEWSALKGKGYRTKGFYFRIYGIFDRFVVSSRRKRKGILLVVLDFGFLLRVFVSAVFLLLHMLLIPKERKG
jgi:hypothetical protein